MLRIRRNKPRGERLCPSCDKQTFWILGIREVGKDPSEHAEEARSQTELCLEGYQVSAQTVSNFHLSMNRWRWWAGPLRNTGHVFKRTGLRSRDSTQDRWEFPILWAALCNRAFPKCMLRTSFRNGTKCPLCFWHGSHGQASSRCQIKISSA